jgi:hypothetical protein
MEDAMKGMNRWHGVALAAAGLLAGSIFGPPVVQAATGLVTIQGAGNAHKAKVNGAGELMVNGAVRPLPPAQPWRASQDVAGSGSLPPAGVVLLAGPTSGPIDISSVSMSVAPGVIDAFADIRLMAAHVPGTATSCTGATFDTTLWHIPDVTSAAPFTESFPTPLQWTPPAGTKACLFAHNLGGPTVTVNAVGFVGG